jgi:hypothetical protein
VPGDGAIDGLLPATGAVIVLALGTAVATAVVIMRVMILKRLTLPLTETMIFLL